MQIRAPALSELDSIEVEDILGEDITLQEGGRSEVMQAYRFNIPEDPLEQLAKIPSRTSLTEHGLFSTAMIESICGRAVRVDVAGAGDKENVRRLIRETIQRFIGDGFVPLLISPAIIGLHGVHGAATFFRKPGVPRPLFWAMPEFDELDRDEEPLDDDDIDAEFELLKTPLPGEAGVWVDERGREIPPPPPGAYDEEIEALKRTGRGEHER